MIPRIYPIAGLLTFAAIGWVAIDLYQTRHTAERYRAQLDDLTASYDQLRTTYNQAVARTAVTELLVEGGRVNVVIRTAEGELKRIETPYDPSNEIYVDYVILGSRLWIRRIFDHKTPPANALVINPLLKDVDWNAQHAHHGKAVYRRLAPGRWTITVTGDGSLGLARSDPTDPTSTLCSPPLIRDYEPLAEARN